MKDTPKTVQEIVKNRAFLVFSIDRELLGSILTRPNDRGWGFYHLGASHPRFTGELPEDIFKELSILTVVDKDWNPILIFK